MAKRLNIELNFHHRNMDMTIGAFQGFGPKKIQRHVYLVHPGVMSYHVQTIH